MNKTAVVATLKEMLDDTQGAMQNEHIWALGAPNNEQARMHSENESNLKVRVENIELIIEVLERNSKIDEFFKDAILAVLNEEELADSEYVEMFTELKKQYC